MSTTNNTLRKLLLLISGLIVGLLLLWLAVKDSNPQQIGERLLQETNFAYSIPFLVLLLLFFWLKAWRWGCLLAMSTAGSLYDRFAAVLIGYTGNLILPAQLGELVRVYILSRQTQSGAMPILTSIALERVFDLLVMLLFLLAAMFISGQDLAWMRTLAYVLSGLILLGLGFAWVYLKYTQQILRLMQPLLQHLGEHWQNKLLSWAEQGAEGLGILQRPALLWQTLISSVLIWLAMSGCIYLALQAAAIHLPFTAAIFTLVVIIGGMMLPASPGFVGTIQFCFVLVLSQYGIEDEQAVASSLFYHLLITLPILLIGYALILKLGFSTKQLKQGAEAMQQSDI